MFRISYVKYILVVTYIMLIPTIIEISLIVLLVYLPLAFGGVTDQALFLLRISAGGSGLLWLLHEGLNRNSRHSIRLVLSVPGMMSCFGLIGWIGLHMVPLPISVIKFLSPQSYDLYTETFKLSNASAPRFLPLSVCTQATEGEFLNLFAFVTIFLVIIRLVRTTRQFRLIVTTILVVGVCESLYGLLQRFSGKALLFFYPYHPWAQGSFVNKNHFAGYISMVILLAFGVLFTRFEQRPSRIQASGAILAEAYSKTFLFLVGLFVMFGALLLSGSRGGLLSFTVGLVCFAGLVHMRRLLRRRSLLLLIFLPLALGLIGFSAPELLLRGLQRFTGTDVESSFQVRREIWRTSWRIAHDFPLTGSGLGTFSNLAQRYQPFRWDKRLQYSESDLLQFLAETGLIGAGLMLSIAGMFWLGVFARWKQRHARQAVAIGAGGLSALLGLIAHGGTDFNLHIPSNALLFTVIAALTYGIVDRNDEHRTHHHARRSTVQNRTLKAPYSTIHAFFRPALMIGLLIYMGFVTTTFWGTLHYKTFLHRTTHVSASNSVKSAEDATNSIHADTADGDVRATFSRTLSEKPIASIRTAIRYDRNQAEYPYALGTYLLRHLLENRESPNTQVAQHTLNEAEKWLRRAFVLDPANPWYAYELGRLSAYRDDCRSHVADTSQTTHCPAVSYYRAALQNAPKHLFLRRAVGQWYRAYDPEEAFRFLRTLHVNDAPNPAETPYILRESAKIWYDLHMDSESDDDLQRQIFHDQPAHERCIPTQISSDPETENEWGHDDGRGEWAAILHTDTARVKKVICLPEDLMEYQTAALKIRMNRVGYETLRITIKIDDQILNFPEQSLNTVPQWHEIPVPLAVLSGKSKVAVYVRCVGSPDAQNALQIWGDRDTVNTQSVFGLNINDDLAPAEGKQAGEYLIRLVLRKSQP